MLNIFWWQYGTAPVHFIFIAHSFVILFLWPISWTWIRIGTQDECGSETLPTGCHLCDLLPGLKKKTSRPCWRHHCVCAVLQPARYPAARVQWGGVRHGSGPPRGPPAPGGWPAQPAEYARRDHGQGNTCLLSHGLVKLLTKILFFLWCTINGSMGSEFGSI